MEETLLRKYKRMIDCPHVKEFEDKRFFEEWAMKNGYIPKDKLEKGYVCVLHAGKTMVYGPDESYFKKHFEIKAWMKSENFENDGEIKSLYDWCVSLEKDYYTVGMKIVNGMSYREALGFKSENKEDVSLIGFKSAAF